MEPTEEMKRMARRVTEASRVSGPLGLGHPNAYKAALAAIMETSEMAANMLGNGDNLYGWEWAERLRSADHLKDSNHV